MVTAFRDSQNHIAMDVKTSMLSLSDVSSGHRELHCSSHLYLEFKKEKFIESALAVESREFL